MVPVEVPGVVGVTATGNLHLKSFYSSYGISTADVAAPDGDSILQRTTAAPNGRVLSTFPAAAFCRPTRTVVGPSTGAKYCSLYAPFPQNSGAPQHCSDGTAFNSFYGSGEVDALKAVS